MAFRSRSAGEARLCVRLQGPPGNPTGIGARVVLHEPDGTRRTASILGGSGYLSQSAPLVLLSAQRGARLDVLWPDGEESSRVVEEERSIRIAHPSRHQD
jgi:hypothetical protein